MAGPSPPTPGIAYLRVARRKHVEGRTEGGGERPDADMPRGKVIPYERFLEKHRDRYGFEPWGGVESGDVDNGDADGSETMTDSSDTPHRVELVMDVRKKIEEGFYRRPEVLEETMRRIVQSLENRRRSDSEARGKE